MIQNAVGRIRTITNHMNKIEPYVGKNFFFKCTKKDKKLSIVNPPLQSEVGGVKEHFFICGLRLFLLIPLCLFIFSPLKHLILDNIDWMGIIFGAFIYIALSFMIQIFYLSLIFYLFNKNKIKFKDFLIKKFTLKSIIMRCIISIFPVLIGTGIISMGYFNEKEVFLLIFFAFLFEPIIMFVGSELISSFNLLFHNFKPSCSTLKAVVNPWILSSLGVSVTPLNPVQDGVDYRNYAERSIRVGIEQGLPLPVPRVMFPLHPYYYVNGYSVMMLEEKMLRIRATDEFKNNHEIAIRAHKIVKEMFEHRMETSNTIGRSKTKLPSLRG
jgi:hypothetical protein